MLLSLFFLGLMGCSSIGPANRVDQTSSAVKPEKTHRFSEILKKNGPGHFEQTKDYLKASYQMMHGQYSSSKSYLKKLLKRSELQNDSFLQTKLALAHIRTGELMDAIRLLQQVYRRDDFKNEKIGLLLAGLLQGTGKTEESTPLYRQLVQRYPSSVNACSYLVNSILVKERFEEAKKQLSQCLVAMPDEGILHLQLGRIEQAQKNFSAAKDSFSKAMSDQEVSSQAALAMGVLLNLQKPGSAIPFFEDYIEKEPKDEAVMAELMEYYFAQENFNRALSYAEQISDRWPQNLSIQVKLGVLYEKTGALKKATEVFKGLLDRAPQSDKILFQVAHLLKDQDALEESITYFSLISPQSELYQESIFQIGRLLVGKASDYQQQGSAVPQKLKNRIELFFNQKYDLSQQYENGLMVLEASYLSETEQKQRAIEVLLELKQKAPLDARQALLLATLYDETNQFDKADKEASELIRREPNNALALNFLGYSLIERDEQMERAFRLISKAVQLEPENGYIRDSLGWYYFKVGQLSKALTEMKKATELVPDDREISKHMAIVYKHVNEQKKAEEFLRLALEFSPSPKQKEEVFELYEQWNWVSRVPASKGPKAP